VCRVSPSRYQQERGGIELSTIVYSDKGEQLEQRNAENGRSEATSLSDEGLSRERSSGQRGRVRVQKDISVTYDYL
jgi:predicted pyridoxine 5'-phosphate oxidase superfamily flavin-nucleotide-binding protein